MRYATLGKRKDIVLGSRTKIIIGIIAVCLVFVVIFFTRGYSEEDRPLLAVVGQKVITQEHINEYDVNFKKDVLSEKVAGVWILVEDTGRDFYRIFLQISHEEETTLKSATLDFNNVEPASALMLTTPGGYPMPSLKFQSIVPSSKGATLIVEDFGLLGKGSVNFEFYLNAAGLGPLQDNSLDVTISLVMHENGEELTAQVQLQIGLP